MYSTVYSNLSSLLSMYKGLALEVITSSYEIITKTIKPFELTIKISSRYFNPGCSGIPV